MAEQPTVNRQVPGSSPGGGASSLGVLLLVLVGVGDVLGVQHLGVAQLLGDPEPVDEQLGVGTQLAAPVVDAAGDGLGALDRQEAVLDEPGLVVLDHRQRVEVAHHAEDLAGLLVLAGVDAGDERLEDDAVDVRLSRRAARGPARS